MGRQGVLVAIGTLALIIPVAWVYGDEPLPTVPPEYADKHMPAGWWTDPKVVDAGRKIFLQGVPDPDEGGKVQKCAKCHGEDGKPTLRGARDFRAEAKMNRFSDSYFFWRVSEGVPKTKMKGWKSRLSEEQRWQAIAYIHTFSHGGKPEEHKHAEIGK
jgi:mono/diheme cytochrome c family protein